MSRAKRLANHIERTVTGPMWHGPALAHVLDGVTADQAAAHPVPGAHSIWEIVLHVTAWVDIGRARVGGDRTGDPTSEEDWPPVAASGAADWQATVNRLAASHRELAAAVRGLSDEALDADVKHLDYSVDVLLHGIIEHGTYHGGQIMLLRKAFESAH